MPSWIESRDVVALALIAGCLVLVALGRASWEQVVTILVLVAGYYFGYTTGYARGVSERRGG
jgi:uncharacterized membrane protein